MSLKQLWAEVRGMQKKHLTVIILIKSATDFEFWVLETESTNADKISLGKELESIS